MSVAADILNGVGGSNGLGDDVGNVICALKGNCVPQNVTYVTAPQQSSGSSLIWILGAAMLVVVLVLVLKK